MEFFFVFGKFWEHFGKLGKNMEFFVGRYGKPWKSVGIVWKFVENLVIS